jgi:hypothetical protein
VASKASGSSSGSSTDLLRPGGWLFCTLLLPQRQRPFTCHNMPACLQHCSTCPAHPPAGPGAFDFTQSDTNGTAFWRLVRNFITKPTPEQEACHAPKPILLDVGEWLWGVGEGEGEGWVGVGVCVCVGVVWWADAWWRTAACRTHAAARIDDNSPACLSLVFPSLLHRRDALPLRVGAVHCGDTGGLGWVVWWAGVHG